MNAESIVSISMNYSGGGSGHTASTVSVLGANDLAESESLGSLIGSLGSRVNFSNSKLNKLFKNFIMTEETRSKDSVKTQINRKFVDKTSLILQSHFVAVRGKDIGPTGGDYSDILFDYTECKQTPVQSFPFKRGVVRGAAIILGNIYNEISETDERTGIKVSIVYQNKNLIPELSYNLGYVSKYYQDNPDLSKSEIKYGYKLSDLIETFKTIGVILVGLPRSTALFEFSGTADSVISSIASSLGLYWYVHPEYGTVNFIPSSVASAYPITNPLIENSENFIDCSYSQSALMPMISNSFMSSTAPLKITPDDGDKQRISRFRVCDILGKLDIELSEETLSTFYGAHCCSAFNSEVFDSIVYKGRGTGKQLNFDKYYSYDEEMGDELISWDKVYIAQGDSQAEKFKGSFDLKNGKFILTSKQNKKTIEPSQSPAFQLISNMFDVLSNSIYISNKYSEWKARRMQFGSSDINISGPYFLDQKLEEIDGLGSIYNLLKYLGVENATVEDLADAANVKGLGDSIFIGIKSIGDKIKPKTPDLYEDFNEKNYITYDDGSLNRTFAAFSPSILKTIDKAVAESKTLYKKITSEDTAKSVKCSYTRSKTPVNEYVKELHDRDTQQAVDDEDSNRTENEQQVSDLFDKMNFVECIFNLNGASGSPLQPVTFEVKKGKREEIALLASYNFGRKASGKKMATSSRTVLGLYIPTFSVAIDGLTFSVGTDGIKTTITESTKKLLPIDDSVIIGEGMKSSVSRSTSSNFSASQRNFFGL